MNILIIGGSYFAGRVFTMIASKEGHRLTLINRGKYSMKDFGARKEFVCERHDYGTLSTLPLDKSYDAVIDFCAYERGDISDVAKNLPCVFHRYIYISTAEVCAQTEDVRDEASSLERKAPENRIEEYTYNKMLLEEELVTCAKVGGFTYTILRPVFIYGPYNYAPRESWYIQNIMEHKPVPHPVDAEAKFQMVYVKDVARAILSAVGNDQAADQIYMLSAPEIVTYGSFLERLRSVSDIAFEILPVTVEAVLKENIPLPFPLLASENKLFSGEKIVRELGFEYGDPEESMRLTFQAFKDVFS